MNAKNRIKGMIIILIVSAVAFPIITLIIMNLPGESSGSSDSWIGYFGSYFGAILSGIVTLLIIKISIYLDQKKSSSEKENFKIFFIKDYLPFIVIQVKSALEIINRQIHDAVIYIPYHELMIESSYYHNISALDLSFKDKFEFLSILHDIKALNYLVKKSEEARSVQNITMLNKNIEIIQTKTIINSLVKNESERDFSELNRIERMYETLIYPEIKSDSLKYVETAGELLVKIEALVSKTKELR